MIIFGWGRRSVNHIGPALKHKCPRCNNEDIWNLYVARTWFTLFFIPVIPYSTKRLLLCPICESGMELSSEKYNELEPIAKNIKDLAEGKITEQEFDRRAKQIEGMNAEHGTDHDS